ncbi:hypothetical protein M9458_055120, partial [Cirrhinus mrigala]
MSAKQKYNTLWKTAKRDQHKADLSHVDNIVIHASSASLESFSEPLQHAQPIEGPQSQSECDVEMQGAHANSDSDSDDADLDDRPSLGVRLAQWANEFQVKHNAVDGLLKILGEHHSELPRTARTLLETCENVNLEMKSGMQYFYFGCKEQLCRHLNMYPGDVVSQLDCLDISLNIDGLPLFKSSSQSLWPVLCKINLAPSTVFPLALCFGVSKPTDLDFFVVQDLRDILLNGLQTDRGHLGVRLRCISCDAPAKALVKCTKQYSGYFGCDKCTQKGFWDGRRVIYPEMKNVTLRTDASFREQLQEKHHQSFGVSPFCMLPIDMIQQFPADYMHQCCLGVMQKLIVLWLCGKLSTRLSSGQVREISSRLLGLRPFMPDLFARKPRGLEDIDRWKATELRQFVLYTGKIVLKGVLSDELYEHFMLFSVPTSSETRTAESCFGDEFLVYNVHSMVHLASDAHAYCGLDECSSFPFENYLHQLK